MAQIRGLMRTLLAMGLALACSGLRRSLCSPAPGSIAGRIAALRLFSVRHTIRQSAAGLVVWRGLQSLRHERRYSDTIQYESIDLSNQAHYGPVPVLGETPCAWDSVYTCNPKVVRGSFANPLGDGKTYTLCHVLRCLATRRRETTINRRCFFQRRHCLEEISSSRSSPRKRKRLRRRPTGGL